MDKVLIEALIEAWCAQNRVELSARITASRFGTEAGAWDDLYAFLADRLLAEAVTPDPRGWPQRA